MSDLTKPDELTALRAEIDRIDEELCLALKKRFQVVKKIGEYKKSACICITDSSRESAVYEHIAPFFDNESEKSAAKSIYLEIITRSKELQK